MTERDLFFELLHKAREFKRLNANAMWVFGFLNGYRLALKQHLEDIKAGQNIADIWRHQNSGAK